jgi:hypothetical protein
MRIERFLLWEIRNWNYQDPRRMTFEADQGAICHLKMPQLARFGALKDLN